MAKRLVRKLTEVADEVERQLKAHYNVKEKDLQAWRTAASHSADFPESSRRNIEDLWIDYEVQRDVLHEHIKNIMRKWDGRICSPVSACQLIGSNRIETYDGQHRTIAATILGFKEIPCAVVVTSDKNFASYAFEALNDTGVKRLTPGDLHRNALVRFKNGSRELRNVRARTMQDQFDQALIDLQDKASRNSDNLRGDHNYFFSHFAYAQKAIDLDEKGKILYNILMAIRENFPLQEEIDQGCFIGLYELQRLILENPIITMPDDWMHQLISSVAKTFKSSHLVHSKSKVQWQYVRPGATWSAPTAMSNFLREMHIRNNGSLNLPYHGEGSKVGIEVGNLAPDLIPMVK